MTDNDDFSIRRSNIFDFTAEHKTKTKTKT